MTRARSRVRALRRTRVPARICHASASSLDSGSAGRRQAAIRQNGFTTTRMTIATMKSAGTSLTMRKKRAGRVFRSSAKARTQRADRP